MSVLDTTGFTKFIENLAKISGKTFEQALVQQTGHIINECLKRTKMAKKGMIVKKVSRHNSHVEFEDGRVVSVWKKADHAEMFLDESNYREPSRGTKHKGRQPTLIKGKSWHQMDRADRRWNPQRWALYQALRRQADAAKVDPQVALASRGVAKQSWLQIANALGIPLPDAKPEVHRARPQNGRTYRNGLARRVLSGAAFYIEISNDNPIVVKKLDGARTLQIAIAKREKAFMHQLRTGVFEDVARRAKLYPGLFVAP